MVSFTISGCILLAWLNFDDGLPSFFYDRLYYLLLLIESTINRISWRHYIYHQDRWEKKKGNKTKDAMRICWSWKSVQFLFLFLMFFTYSLFYIASYAQPYTNKHNVFHFSLFNLSSVPYRGACLHTLAIMKNWLYYGTYKLDVLVAKEGYWSGCSAETTSV